MTTVLITLLAAALVLVAALAILLARVGRRVSDQTARIAELEAQREIEIREQVGRRLREQEQTLRQELGRRESELVKREDEVARRHGELAERRLRLEERAAALDSRAEELAERATALDARAAALDERERRLGGAEDAIRHKLEEVAGLGAEEARKRLRAEVEAELQTEVARLIQKAEEQARSGADELARELLIRAMASLRGSVAGEGTITVVQLPSDEMKGRVIGREGRNIRSLEHATGVDLLVDDTPRAILLSSWDPMRRTIAARALRKLVEDGRIHPARIEEVVEKSRQEADEEARERGEAVVFELGLSGVHERLVLLLGRLSFLTDHGQNLLQRAREVALVAGQLADDLRYSGEMLRRAALFHEIARADKVPLLTHSAIASADLATRFGEAPPVAHAIRSLSQTPDSPRTAEGMILATARRVVLSRPGARDENLQRHMDRLREAETLALARPEIEVAVAVRAGRELRVHVRADGVPDEQTAVLARNLALEIERRIDYPGQVRVVVVRETRAVSYAV
ncbi:MAG: DUF3552 domain-containing protein [Acidobacteria bacterium]|nr:DUF3552 domain-containing protein [Acidobacteriota bacterium]